MAAPQATAGRVYASAVAADAFARSLLQAHEVPPEDAAIIANWLVSAGFREILIPGEPEDRYEAERRRTGIPYAASEVAALQDEAKKAGIQPLVVADKPVKA